MKKKPVIFFVLFFIVCIYFFMMISPVIYTGMGITSDTLMKKTTVTGHRGAGGLAPENTLAAIDTAISVGVNRVEVDVRQTKDGKIICIHDDKLDRTSNGKGDVCEYTYAQINKMDAGSWFSLKYKNEKIPELEQVLKKTMNKVILLIEIKDGSEVYPGIENNVVNLIKKSEARQWTIIQSFNDSVLLRIHKIDPEIKLHKLLIADFPFLYLLYDGNFRITKLENYDFVEEFSIYQPFATKRFIQNVHKLNKKVNVWTVNDTIKINRLINLGVDGIITDYPDFIVNKN